MKLYLVQTTLKVTSYIIKTNCSKEINVDNANLRSKLICLDAIWNIKAHMSNTCTCEPGGAIALLFEK